MTGKVEVRDRKAYIVVTHYDDREPIERRLFWRLGISPSELCEENIAQIDGQRVTVNINNFGSLATIEVGRYNYWRCEGPAGNEKTEFVESRDVPPPKCRTETRWHNGGWQKLLKSKGWVAA